MPKKKKYHNHHYAQLAAKAGSCWGRGQLADPNSAANLVQRGMEFTEGDAPNILDRPKLKLTENQLRQVIRRMLLEATD